MPPAKTPCNNSLVPHPSAPAQPPSLVGLSGSQAAVELSEPDQAGVDPEIPPDADPAAVPSADACRPLFIMEKNFSRRISLMRITLPSGEIVRAIWLLDTDPAGLPLIQAIR